MIVFKGITNYPYMMVNLLRLKLPDQTILDIDRETTEYSIDENGSFYMEWHRPYVWDGEDMLPIPTDSLEDASFFELEVEDDADEDYYVTVKHLIVNDLTIL